MNPFKIFIKVFACLFLLTNGYIIKAQDGSPISMSDTLFNDYFIKTKLPTISGKIINASKDELSKLVISYTLVTPFVELQSSKTAYINEDGSFFLPLDYPFPYQQIWFDLGNHFYSCLYVNEELTIDLDFSKLKQKKVFFFGNGVNFGGRDGNLNVWINKATIFKQQSQLDISDKINSLDWKSKDYFNKLDSLFLLKKSLQNEFVASNPSQYAWILKNESLSEYYEKTLNGALLNGREPDNWNEIKSHKSYLSSNAGMIFNKRMYEYFRYYKCSVKLNNYSIKKEAQELDNMFGTLYADILKMQIHSNDILYMWVH